MSAPRPYWRAALVSALVVAALATVLMTAYTTYDTWRMDEAHLFECDGCVRPAAAFSLGWLGLALATFTQLAVMALPAAFVLAGAMWGLERLSLRLRAPLAWLLVGAALATPLAIVFWLFGQMHECFDEGCHDRPVAWGWTLVGPAFVYAHALIGAFVAWRVRHGARG